MPLWRRILNTLATLTIWKGELIRSSANNVADNLAKLGPPVEMLFTSSLPIHIWNLYSLEQCSTTPQQRQDLLDRHAE